MCSAVFRSCLTLDCVWCCSPWTWRTKVTGATHPALRPWHSAGKMCSSPKQYYWPWHLAAVHLSWAKNAIWIDNRSRNPPCLPIHRKQYSGHFFSIPAGSIDEVREIFVKIRRRSECARHRPLVKGPGLWEQDSARGQRWFSLKGSYQQCQKLVRSTMRYYYIL